MLILGLSVKIVAQPKVENPVAASPEASVIHKPIETDTTDQLQGSGLMGYITSKAPQPTSGYGAGIGFYVAVYPILPHPIADFQIGLASTWIIPKNADNTTKPLCPPGSYARDNWSDGRGPTFHDVFQTIEGGLGMWGSTQFRAGYKQIGRAHV